MTSEELIENVRRTVLLIEPHADVLLYGSRARGDAYDDSDWDFLILLNGPVDDARTDTLRHALYEIEWTCGEVLSAVVMNAEEWRSPRYQVTPFYKQVQREGAQL